MNEKYCLNMVRLPRTQTDFSEGTIFHANDHTKEPFPNSTRSTALMKLTEKSDG